MRNLLIFFSTLTCVISNVEVTKLRDVPNHAISNTSLHHCMMNEIRLEEREQIPIKINCSQYVTFNKWDVLVENDKVASLELSDSTNSYPEGTIFVRGLFLGHARLLLTPLDNNTTNSSSPQILNVTVTRKKSILDIIFIISVTTMMALSYIGMGCAIDLQVVKEVLKKPVAPSIGFCCQYLLMPLISYTTAYLLGLGGSIGLGYFASGCAPGGGASNMYAYLLGGDASLSITMTVVSTLAALGMFPLWIYTLGSTISGVGGTRFKIPFFNIIASLATMIIPLAIGALIKVKRPNWASILLRLLRPFFILVILFLFTFGVWANLYIVYSITPRLIIAACCLSYSGFILGGLIAWVLRQPLNRVIAIAIETGVQNTGLPILLLKFSLPQPEADLSVVAPVTLAMLMPLPLWLAIFVVEIRKCLLRRSQKEAKEPILNSPTSEMDHPISSIINGNIPNGSALGKKASSVSECLTNSTSTPGYQ